MWVRCAAGRSTTRLNSTWPSTGTAASKPAATRPLTKELLSVKSEFRWINHTYTHPYLGCVQDFSVSPWRCAIDPATGAMRWVSTQDIANEITRNTGWARERHLPIDDRELVTGQHSGLRSLPQMLEDNPNLTPALQVSAVKFIAADASRERGARVIGPARMIPRHPMNIFYNTGTRDEAVDLYNWIYNSRADGGSGICESNPASTCIAPLGPDGFDSYIVPMEARIAFDHVVGADPRPHFAHQSNITEDKVLYPVLNALLARYRTTFTEQTPLVNPQFAAVGQLMRRQELWRRAVADGTVTGSRQGTNVTVVNTGRTSVDAPVTVPAGTRVMTVNLFGTVLGEQFGQAYAGQRSAWHTLRPDRGLTVRLPS